MPDHLIVIPSGATAYDLEARIRGSLDMPLAPAGAAEAATIAARLAAVPPDALYASDDAAAAETARIVARACGLRPRRIAGLGNLDQGLWQGMLVEEIRTKQPRLHRQWLDNPWSIAPPEGEDLETACARVEAALETVLRRHPAGRVALVLPRPLDRIMRWVVAATPIGDLWTCERCPEGVVELPLAAQWKTARRRRTALA